MKFSNFQSFWPTVSILFFYFAFPDGVQTAHDDTTFDFGIFSSGMSDIALERDANIIEPVIDLTKDLSYINSVNGSVGRATYSKPVHLWDKDSGNMADFTTQFSFVINSLGNSTVKGNGFAFFLAPNGSQIPPSSGGGYLGLVAGPNSSTAQSAFVAVEFDTARSTWDPQDRDEHIGIDLNSLTSAVTVPWASNDIPNGGTINATVQYNSGAKNLSVLVINCDYSRNLAIVWFSLFAIVDLRNLLPEWVTLGFSAATTTTHFEKHQIHSWNFVSSLELPDENPPSGRITPQPSQNISPNIGPQTNKTTTRPSPPRPPSPPLPEIKRNKVSAVVIALAISFVALVLLLGLLCYCCSVKKRRQRPLLKWEKSSQKNPLKSNHFSGDEALEEKSILQSLRHENNRTPADEGFVEQSNLGTLWCENNSIPADAEGLVENIITVNVITHGYNNLPTGDRSEEIRPRSPRDENNSSEGIEEKSIAQTLAHESSNSPEDEGFEKGISSETNSKSESNHLTSENNGRPAEEGSEEKYSPRSFSYQELVTATKDFTHLLGEGGFGRVYKGVVPYGNSQIDVAVKKMAPDPDMVHSGKQQAYQAEVKAISQLRHDHLVQLIGWCQENEEFFIVYEFMANGNLETHLFDSNSSLDWKQRYGIALGLASALSYMHGEPDKDYVLHRDIKPNNILLDSNFKAKLGDFGLAKLVESGNPARTTKLLLGTERYVAPEYVKTWKPSKKTDIYSFGIVALEIATGRAAVEEVETEDRKQEICLSNLVEMQYRNNNILDLADPKLRGDFEEHEMERLMVVGLACAHPDENVRPQMREVLKMLKGETRLPDLQYNRCWLM